MKESTVRMKLPHLALSVLLVTAGIPAPTIAADGGRPLADAGLDQSATVGSTVYLDGGGSVDPDGDLVSYEWSIESPSGETVTPRDPDAAMTRFVPDEPGRYHVRLAVTGDDGQTQSDTLFVDIGRPEDQPSTETRDTATPVTGETPAASPEPTPSPPDETGTTAPAEDSGETNRPPSGRIVGPSSVTSGSRATYTIEASDLDGYVSERWWLPSTLSTGRAGPSERRGGARTLTVDGTPGTTEELSAIVVDDDGATETLTKSVEISNTPPVASIEGDDAAMVNTTHEYRLTATDPDGEITSVSLVTGADVAEPTGPMPWDGATSSGEWARSFRFSGIPEDDGTVTFEATVRDEHGGVTTVEKSVTVVGGVENDLSVPLSQSSPEILSLDASLENAAGGDAGGSTNTRQVQFDAVATDADSDRLTFEWRLGDVAVLQNTARGRPARASISRAFPDADVDGNEIPVTLTVRDQNGNEESMTKSLQFRSEGTARSAVGRSRPIEIQNVRGRVVQGRFQAWRGHAGQEVVIHFGDESAETITLEHAGDRSSTRFSHRYASAGRYSISADPQWSPDVSAIPVNVGSTTYSMWTYERKATTIYRTTAAERPGDEWEREGIARVEREQTGVETMRTLADSGRAISSPGLGWKRVGTATEYHTERRTTRSTDHPGGDWSVAERNVDQRQVFTGWQHTTIPQKGLLGGDWEYVGAVPRTVDRTETERSADRPSGSGWSRGERVGRTQVDYQTRWVDYTFHADPDWQYLGLDRYVSGYDETTTCVDYIQLYRTRHCLEKETKREPEYDYRYEYRVPQYDTVYEWERTVEETEYEYRYRAATYAIEAVHEYEKEVRVGTQYAQWEKPIIETTNIYRWKTTGTSWEESSSLSKPIGEVRNLERQVKECGAARDPGEPAICEQGES